MTGRKKANVGLMAIGISLALAAAAAIAQQAQTPTPPVKFGMVNTLFRDVPPSVVPMLTPPFLNLLRLQTGLEGDVVSAGDALDLGKRLNDKQVQFGVFHGVEFAWARQQYPDLRPIMIAFNRQRSLKAYVAVRSDSDFKTLSDLKGKAIAIPKRTREHCHLFLGKEMTMLQTDAKQFFSKIANQANIEDGMDDVLRDKVQAVLVDGVALENYEQVKPGCYARLRIVKESEPFPPGVVAYRQGAIDNTTLKKFRDGMISANQTARGKELLALWKLTAFEAVPANFDESLAAIIKAYPPPAPKSPR